MRNRAQDWKTIFLIPELIIAVLSPEIWYEIEAYTFKRRESITTEY